ncbi:DUF3316 domain-containing protein [Vibrio sp. F74]|uniref:DUF3316 domain-containing protein n=1 Tax=Vibrio sp. F74 TaxID=700020 RepID=UPI0035F5D086
MKLIKSVTISTILLLSTSVFAGQYVPTPGNYVERLNSSTIDTEVMKTKDDAYKAGLEILTKLYTSSSSELFSSLRVIGKDVNKNTMHINDGGYITVEEMMDVNGGMMYRGVLNVSYHFAERERQ